MIKNLLDWGMILGTYAVLGAYLWLRSRPVKAPVVEAEAVGEGGGSQNDARAATQSDLCS